MITFKIKTRTQLAINNSVEGETLETKVDRIVNNKEPIKDGAPLIYTQRKDGVQPEYDIRTDRWEVAIEATDKIAKSYTARRNDRLKVVGKEDGNEGGTEPSQYKATGENPTT